MPYLCKWTLNPLTWQVRWRCEELHMLPYCLWTWNPKGKEDQGKYYFIKMSSLESLVFAWSCIILALYLGMFSVPIWCFCLLFFHDRLLNGWDLYLPMLSVSVTSQVWNMILFLICHYSLVILATILFDTTQKPK